MSIISYPKIDDSAMLYKLFVDNITGARKTDHKLMQIPLSNLFRLMEMYRYDAYEDGTRDKWHVPIAKGLDLAKEKAFGALTKKEVCVDAIEASLRKMANEEQLSTSETSQLNVFMNTFKASI